MNLVEITSKTGFKKIIIAPVMVSKTDGAPHKIIADVGKQINETKIFDFFWGIK